MRSQAESILGSALRNAIRRVTLERAVQVAIVASIVTSVLAAGAVLGWLETARMLRWVALGALVSLSVVYAWRWRGGPRPSPLVYGAAAAFVVLAFVSAAWSAFPALTTARASALALLFVACGALARATAGRPDAIRALVDAVLAATVLVAVGGLVLLVVDFDRAVAAATTVTPARYQGLGGGPDTATMVLAVGVPLAAHALFASTSRLGPVFGGVALALLLGSVVASGSRGALAASFVGLLVVALFAPRTRARRLAAAGSVLALLLIAIPVIAVPDPLPPGSANPPAASVAPYPTETPLRPRPGYADANFVLRLQDDVGRPARGVADTRRRVRTLLGSSGRADAWSGALGQAAGRPLLGYGFGTEDRVFVDRYVDFNSGVPENSYVGLLLQLGAVGMAAFLVLVASLVGAVRMFGLLCAPERLLAAACFGGLVAGLSLACVQSYVYAVGNNATAAVWLCAFLLPATVTQPVPVARS